MGGHLSADKTLNWLDSCTVGYMEGMTLKGGADRVMPMQSYGATDPSAGA